MTVGTGFFEACCRGDREGTAEGMGRTLRIVPYSWGYRVLDLGSLVNASGSVMTGVESVQLAGFPAIVFVEDLYFRPS